MGWYVMALVDCYDQIMQAGQAAQSLAQLLKEALDGLLRYQDAESCLFYQVIDQPDLPGNYLETSGSAMIAYALLKGVRLRMLDAERYAPIGRNILCALEAGKMRMDHGTLHLKDICRTAGLGPADDLRRNGTPAYYVSEPIVEDNAHGSAALIMAYSQERMLSGKGERK